MSYAVKIMDSHIPANLPRLPPGNVLHALNESRAPGRTSSATSNGNDIIDHADGRAGRKYRWKNTPGIRVSLQALDQEPQIDEYRRLRSDGRRNGSEKVTENNINRTIEADQFDKVNNRSERSVNPRSKIILDSFIQQMVGAEQSLSSGSYINTSV